MPHSRSVGWATANGASEVAYMLSCLILGIKTDMPLSQVNAPRSEVGVAVAKVSNETKRMRRNVFRRFLCGNLACIRAMFAQSLNPLALLSEVHGKAHISYYEQ